MANTRLFDSWQIGMDLPAPFDRAIDGRRAVFNEGRGLFLL